MLSVATWGGGGGGGVRWQAQLFKRPLLSKARTHGTDENDSSIPQNFVTEDIKVYNYYTTCTTTSSRTDPTQSSFYWGGGGQDREVLHVT